jgi:hypothetical protein
VGLSKSTALLESASLKFIIMGRNNAWLFGKRPGRRLKRKFKRIVEGRLHDDLSSQNAPEEPEAPEAAAELFQDGKLFRVVFLSYSKI